jgi:hypothetical protein
MRAGRHLSVRAGQNIWHRYVDPVQAGTRSHMGRHTAITNCLRATQDLWKAVSLAGHSSPRLGYPAMATCSPETASPLPRRWPPGIRRS